MRQKTTPLFQTRRQPTTLTTLPTLIQHSCPLSGVSPPSPPKSQLGVFATLVAADTPNAHASGHQRRRRPLGPRDATHRLGRTSAKRRWNFAHLLFPRWAQRRYLAIGQKIKQTGNHRKFPEISCRVLAATTTPLLEFPNRTELPPFAQVMPKRNALILPPATYRSSYKPLLAPISPNLLDSCNIGGCANVGAKKVPSLFLSG